MAVVLEIDSKNLSLTEKIYSLGDRSTFHGISSILSKKKSWAIRLLWLVSFVASTYFLVQDEIIMFNDFLSFSVDTVLEIKKTSSETFFPTITICHTQVCGFKNYSYDYYIDFYLNESYSKYSKIDLLQKLEINELITAAQKSFLENHDKRDLERVINDKKVSIADILISCQFNRMPCFAQDFEFFQIDELYKCYKFNSGRFFNGTKTNIKSTKKHGKLYGLRLKVFSGIKENCNSPWKVNQGMTIFIHNHSQNASIYSEKVELSIGRVTNIAIDRSIVLKQPAPYSNCIHDQDSLKVNQKKIVRQTFLLTAYSQTSCIQLCYQEALIQKYNCYDKYLPITNFTRAIQPCSRIDDASLNAVFNDQTFVMQNQYSMCVEECPPECDSVYFDKTISSSQFPSLSYGEALLYNQRIAIKDNKMNETVIKDSILGVDVFYRTGLEKVVVETPAMEIGIFLANFGGTMGFYLGLSFLSFIEIVEFFYESILSFIEIIFYKLNKATIARARKSRTIRT